MHFSHILATKKKKAEQQQEEEHEEEENDEESVEFKSESNLGESDTMFPAMLNFPPDDKEPEFDADTIDTFIYPSNKILCFSYSKRIIQREIISMPLCKRHSSRIHWYVCQQVWERLLLLR